MLCFLPLTLHLLKLQTIGSCCFRPHNLLKYLLWKVKTTIFLFCIKGHLNTLKILFRDFYLRKRINYFIIIKIMGNIWQILLSGVHPHHNHSSLSLMRLYFKELLLLVTKQHQLLHMGFNSLSTLNSTDITEFGDRKILHVRPPTNYIWMIYQQDCLYYTDISWTTQAISKHSFSLSWASISKRFAPRNSNVSHR